MTFIISRSELPGFYNSVSIAREQRREGSMRDFISNSYKKILYDHNFPIKKALDIGYAQGFYSTAAARRGFAVDAVDITDLPNLSMMVNTLDLKNVNTFMVSLDDFITGVPAMLNPEETNPEKIQYKPYDLVVSRNILHLFPQQKVYDLLSVLAEAAPVGAVHYITFLTNIRRYFKGGTNEAIEVEGEAKFEHTDTTSLSFQNDIKGIYWDHANITEDKIKVENSTSLGKPFIFEADKVKLIAKKK